LICILNNRFTCRLQRFLHSISGWSYQLSHRSIYTTTMVRLCVDSKESNVTLSWWRHC